jgi:hypothetical protein
MTLQLDSRAKKTGGPQLIRGEELLGSAERFNDWPETAVWRWAKVGTGSRQLLEEQLGVLDAEKLRGRLNGDPRSETIPVVILTSSKEARDLVGSYGLGANSNIQEPADFDQFHETVKQVGRYCLVMNESLTKIQTAAAAGSTDGR